MSAELLFFTCVDRRYEHFIVPFLHFARLSNPGSCFEIMVEEPSRMALAPDCVFTKLNAAPARTRFIEEPETKSKYVYITDVDIMITDEVPKFHIRKMAETGFSFSNVVRYDSPRMTGLHFVDSERWYRDTEASRAKYRRLKGPGDEVALFHIVNETYPGISVSRSYSDRPVPGIHCSPHRPTPNGSSRMPGWNVRPGNLARFKTMAKTLTETDPKFKANYLDVLLSLKPEDIGRVQMI